MGGQKRGIEFAVAWHWYDKTQSLRLSCVLCSPRHLKLLSPQLSAKIHGNTLECLCLLTKPSHNTQRASDNTHPNGHPHWFSPEQASTAAHILPFPFHQNPHLDIVSFIFSKNHNGVSALTDYSSGFSISYSQLHPLVKSMASGLHQMGFSQVSLRSGNKQFGCSLSLAFTVPETSEKLGALGVPVIGVPENGSFNSKSKEFSTFHWLISGDPDCCPRPVINQHDVAAIMYSSGTTGSTKAVVLTHGNFIAMVETFVRFEASLYENSGSENVYLAVLPMKFDANEMVKAIDRYRVTHFPVVPPVLMALIKSARAAGAGCFGSLKQVCLWGCSLTQKSIQEFVQTLSHVDLIQGYGMTESTAVGTRGFNTKKLRNYSSIGLLAPNMRAKVVDLSSGSLLPPGNCGELWLQGPGIMKGYLNDEEATISTIDKEGWLHTGDIVSFDQDGYLYMFSRIKEIIKYKGFQIAPVDLESILISHPEISDAAVAGTGKQIHEQICYNLTEMWSWSPPEIDNSVVELRVGDEEAGEVPVAFVVKRPGSALSQAAIINYVEKQVAPYKKVRKVIFTHSIPKSAAGKILRRELKHLLMISRI
ncbi:4-coumarate--CoA ligase-like 6 [Vitis vinifera]|uniref:4-coumarate--CoA ligase n=1 Tax=Vitis vinifera TaxID=29760 RepID=A0A438DGY3_VITVI|nr:4-coumarate--CoA ligase-like 6 [Vitis vinifera]